MTVAAFRPPQPQSGRRLSVTASTWASGKSKHITVTVSGEVDACNAKDFAVAVCAAVGDARRATLDLADLHFFAIDGVTALHAVNAHLARADVPWCVLASRTVARVLGLCDPEGLIPLGQPDRALTSARAALRLVEPA